MSYKVPVEDQLFVLKEVLELENYQNLPANIAQTYQLLKAGS